MTFLNFQSNPKSNDLVNTITPQKLHVPCCSIIGIFFISEFQPSFMLIFHCSSRSSCLGNITPQNLPALCCNFIGMFFTENSRNSSILTFVTLLNCQTSPRSGCLLNITHYELHASCNFTGKLVTSKSLTSLVMTYL